jgi:DNA-binding CsgD family transcriptional regulator
LANPATRIVNVRGDVLLTEREEQVVSLVGEGINNREIAEQLGVKENTVKKCLLHVYDKLGVCNRVELVLYALSHRAGSSRTSEVPSVVPELSSRIKPSVRELAPESINE